MSQEQANLSTGQMMTTLHDEFRFMTKVVMPFLREHWDSIDRPERHINRADGRLTRDELMLSYQDALSSGRKIDAFILNELLLRYEPICRAYADGYWFKEETALGISEQDISVYAQLSDPAYRKRDGLPSPKPWF
jgi:hypothetical protein